MFNLEKAISNWRFLLRSNNLTEPDIAELESHLRDCIDELSALALSAQECFLIASFRLGDSDSLADEFSKSRLPELNTLFLPLMHVAADGWVDEQVYAGFSRRLIVVDENYARVNAAEQGHYPPAYSVMA